MNKYTLVDALHIYPTPAGAYYALSSAEENESRCFLKYLLQQPQSPPLNVENLLMLTHTDNEEKAFELLHHCQRLGWVQGLSLAIKPPEGILEEFLPLMLNKISNNGKVLLADHQGFHLASSGFTHEVAEELSALGAEISTLQLRRSNLLMHNMGVDSHAWGVVNATGKSQVGFWPIFIGTHRFVITVLGTPHFNQPEFVSLAWALSIRYALKN